MHPAEDVEAYAHARWSDAVRTLLALGATVEEAEEAARLAWERTWRAWRREHRAGDVDVLVFGELLEAWGWPGAHPEVGPDVVARVLVAEGRVSEHAAERISGGDPSGAPLAAGPPDDADLYRAPAPVAEIRDVLRRRRRRTTVRVAVAAGVVAVAAGFALVLSADPPPPEPRPEVVNPLPLAWWAEGTLHLGSSELAVPRLVELAQAGRGATYPVVYGDDQGAVFQVDDASDPEQVGRSVIGSTISASPDGRAAWVDISDAGQTVVVWDTAARAEVARLELTDATVASPTQVVTIDGDVVYLRSSAGASRWAIGEATTEQLPEEVLDSADDVLLMASVAPADAAAALVAAPRRFEVGPDHLATLSPGGLVAAAWVPGQPDLTLVGAGANLTTVPLDLPRRSAIEEARFAPDGDLVLALTRGRAGAGSEEPVTLATCVLQTGVCDELGARAAPVVLAG